LGHGSISTAGLSGALPDFALPPPTAFEPRIQRKMTQVAMIAAMTTRILVPMAGLRSL
jgi:hypothetical protein